MKKQKAGALTPAFMLTALARPVRWTRFRSRPPHSVHHCCQPGNGRRSCMAVERCRQLWRPIPAFWTASRPRSWQAQPGRQGWRGGQPVCRKALASPGPLLDRRSAGIRLRQSEAFPNEFDSPSSTRPTAVIPPLILTYADDRTLLSVQPRKLQRWK